MFEPLLKICVANLHLHLILFILKCHQASWHNRWGLNLAMWDVILSTHLCSGCYDVSELLVYSFRAIPQNCKILFHATKTNKNNCCSGAGSKIQHHCKNWVVNKIKFCLELPHADQACSWIIKYLNFKYISCLHGSQGGFQFYSVFTGDAECHEWFLWVCAKHLICDYAGVEHEYLFVYLQRSWSGESCQRWLCEEHIQTMICKILVSHQTLTPGYCVSNANESCKSSK